MLLKAQKTESFFGVCLI